MCYKSVSQYPSSNNLGKLIEVSVSFLCVFFSIKGCNMTKETLCCTKQFLSALINTHFQVEFESLKTLSLSIPEDSSVTVK